MCDGRPNWTGPVWRIQQNYWVRRCLFLVRAPRDCITCVIRNPNGFACHNPRVIQLKAHLITERIKSNFQPSQLLPRSSKTVPGVPSTHSFVATSLRPRFFLFFNGKEYSDNLCAHQLFSFVFKKKIIFLFDLVKARSCAPRLGNS